MHNDSKEGLSIALPDAYIHELNHAVPLRKHGLHRKADQNVRANLSYQIWRAMNNKAGQVRIWQRLVDCMWGSRHRKSLMSAIQSTKMLQAVEKAEHGNRSISYRLSPTFFKPKRMTVPPYTGGFSKLNQDSHWYHCWIPATASTEYTLQGAWLRRLPSKYGEALKGLGLSCDAFQKGFTWSLNRTEFLSPDSDVCMAAANKKFKACPKDCWPVDKLANLYADHWGSLQVCPTEYFFRKSGRLYWPLVNQHKDLRRQLIRFHIDGRTFLSGEVDLTSSYFAFIAVASQSRSLKRDIEAGVVYEELRENCRNAKFRDRPQLKRAAQIQILFGQDGYGTQPLYAVFGQRYPRAMDYINSFRFSGGRLDPVGASKLSQALSRQEGAWFIDKMLPRLKRRRIPALPIHDGWVVPADFAEDVGQLSQKFFRRDLRVIANFKVKNCAN